MFNIVFDVIFKKCKMHIMIVRNDNNSKISLNHAITNLFETNT